MFSGPWGFIISSLPQALNFLSLLPGAHFPRSSFSSFHLSLNVTSSKRPELTTQFNNAPAFSTLSLTLPYLVFFLELATV